MRRYLGIGLTILLIMAALLVPGWWFALRDVTSLNHMQGETLAPLMVAQLDRSYENDIYERMSTYFAACALGDVICSSKEVDAANDALWENVAQAEQSMLMEMLLGTGYISPYGEKWGVVDSCTQYVLIRESDGQILLVANDIHLKSGDGRHTELLIDGLDGTVYYAESEEYLAVPLQDWVNANAWEGWWILSENYHAESANVIVESETENVSAYNKEVAVLSGYFEDVERIKIMGTAPLNAWVASWEDRDVYCCQLAFGHISDSWSLETEQLDKSSYRIRLGFPGVVNFIPEMAERIELAKYDQIYSLPD